MTEQSLATLAGHHAAAMDLVGRLLDGYRDGGLTRLRVLAEAYLNLVDAEGTCLLLVEAVLTIAERTGNAGSTARRDWAHFDADEDRTEAQQTETGGNR